MVLAFTGPSSALSATFLSPLALRASILKWLITFFNGRNCWGQWEHLQDEVQAELPQLVQQLLPHLQ